MAQLLASYTLAGRRHRIELVPAGRRRLLIDRPADGPARLVAELAPDEGQQHAIAVRSPPRSTVSARPHRPRRAASSRPPAASPP